MQKSDGMNYAPTGKASPVCGPGEFRFAAIGLDHGHIFGMCNGLVEAGGELAWVFDPDPQKVAAFCGTYGGVKVARSEAEILDDPAVQLIASAAVPCLRGPLGLRVMDRGKDYFADKPPITSLEQLDAARRKVTETGRIYAAYYSERLHVEAAVKAGDMIQQGAIGRVVQVIGLGPHRLNAPTRPAWFWDPQRAEWTNMLLFMIYDQRAATLWQGFTLPVQGVPVETKTLKGMDSLLSIVQMPPGVPVGTLAIGHSGAVNAGLLAASIAAVVRGGIAIGFMAPLWVLYAVVIPAFLVGFLHARVRTG